MLLNRLCRGTKQRCTAQALALAAAFLKECLVPEKSSLCDSQNTPVAVEGVGSFSSCNSGTIAELLHAEQHLLVVTNETSLGQIGNCVPPRAVSTVSEVQDDTDCSDLG